MSPSVLQNIGYPKIWGMNPMNSQAKIYHLRLLLIISTFLFVHILWNFTYGQTSDTSYQRIGIIAKLPVFTQNQLQRLSYPASWLSGQWKDFNAWKKEARKIVFRCLLARPPVASFNPAIIAEEDRGSYLAQKVVFNLTADSRVLGYLLIPKGQGPFPAVLLFHDLAHDLTLEKRKSSGHFPQRNTYRILRKFGSIGFMGGGSLVMHWPNEAMCVLQQTR